MIPFARLSIAAATSIALTSAFLLSANSARAYIIDGGQTVNINDQITTNSEDVLLYSGTVNLNPGGIIGNALYLMYGDSVANFVGGTIENYAYLNNGVLNISSGDIRNDITAGISTWANGQPMGLGQVNIYGGNFMNPNGSQYLLHASGKGRLDLYGGNLTNRKLFAQQTGAIYIHGSNFNYDYGILPTRTGTLSGTLLSGETFGMDFETIGLGSVHLIAAVPEPSTCSSLAAGLAFGCWRLRCRRTSGT